MAEYRHTHRYVVSLLQEYNERTETIQQNFTNRFWKILQAVFVNFTNYFLQAVFYVFSSLIFYNSTSYFSQFYKLLFAILQATTDKFSSSVRASLQSVLQLFCLSAMCRFELQTSGEENDFSTIQSPPLACPFYQARSWPIP